MKTKNTTLLLAASLALTLFTSGCSTMMCGKTQTVPITSRPPGAEVTITDKYNDVVFAATTPCDVTLNRGDSERGAAYYKVALRKEGYKPVDIELNGVVNRAYAANIMNAGIGAITVDPYTGAKWTLSPMEVLTVLEPTK